MNIETEQQLNEILTRHKVVAVDFYADWCVPCKSLGKILNAYEGDTLIVKVDCDISPELAQKYGVRGIPFVVKFEDGQIVDSFSGLVSQERLERFLG